MPKNLFHRKYIFLAIVGAALLLLFFYLRNDIRTFSAEFLRTGKQEIRSELSCKPQHIDESVLAARKVPQDRIKLLVTFNEKPSQDARDYLKLNNVEIDLNTWVTDFLYADAKVSALCFLDSVPGVMKISLGEL